MVKNHLSSIAAPKTWRVKRKETQFLPKTSCGPHSFEQSIPLCMVMKDMLKWAKTTHEVKRILNQSKVLVNKAVRKDIKFPVGLMDIIESPVLNEHYRMLFDHKGRFITHKIPASEANTQLVKITGKTLLKGNKMQLNFNDGTNMLIEKDEFKVGDSLAIDATQKKIKDHLKFEKGATIYLAAGKQVSKTGLLEGLKQFKGSKEDNILLKTKEGKIETSKSYAFVIGKEKAIISLPEEK